MAEGEASAPPQPATPARRGRLTWVRAAADRVPTRWFTSIATALFLAVTAAFGGMATAAVPAPAELAAGQEHRNAQLALTVRRAVLLDEFPEAGVWPEEGERVLVLDLDVENVWTRPLATGGDASVSAALRVQRLGDAAPASVARYDDATGSPWLQPGVPARVVVTWTVEASAIADGDELRVDVRDETLYTGSVVLSGQYWEDPKTAAVVTVRVEDLGAGAGG